MNKIINNSQPLPICEGCPFNFIRVMCDSVQGTPDVLEKEYRLECTHISACERALQKAQESHDSN